jgi:hypothetical protein
MRKPRSNLKNSKSLPNATIGGNRISHWSVILILLGIIFLFFGAISTYSLVPSHAADLSADFNGDNRVDSTDFNLLRSNWGSTNASHTQGDANGDKVVNALDLSILASE